jgi:hypothetical protein
MVPNFELGLFLILFKKIIFNSFVSSFGKLNHNSNSLSLSSICKTIFLLV